MDPVTRFILKPIVGLTNPLGNYLFNLTKDAVYNNMKNFSGDAGIFNLIPKDIR